MDSSQLYEADEGYSSMLKYVDEVRVKGALQQLRGLLIRRQHARNRRDVVRVPVKQKRIWQGIVVRCTTCVFLRCLEPLQVCSMSSVVHYCFRQCNNMAVLMERYVRTRALCT